MTAPLLVVLILLAYPWLLLAALIRGDWTSVALLALLGISIHQWRARELHANREDAA